MSGAVPATTYAAPTSYAAPTYGAYGSYGTSCALAVGADEWAWQGFTLIAEGWCGVVFEWGWGPRIHWEQKTWSDGRVGRNAGWTHTSQTVARLTRLVADWSILSDLEHIGTGVSVGLADTLTWQGTVWEGLERLSDIWTRFWAVRVR